jgi:Protein of Unknown function (DUF2784)
VILLAVLVLSVHFAWLALVIFGAIWTRGRPLATALHILALLWGIVVELGPWPCPLTVAESYFETRAGLPAYQGSFLLHYLDAIVYPDLPGWIVTGAGVAVCALNLAIYGWRWRRSHIRHRSGSRSRSIRVSGK